MALSVGARLGVYEVVAAIGAGGMGEVYRATDTKLGRAVAIKVLPDALASDPDRIARVEREAKALAALNHPNVAAIYGFEELTNPESRTPNPVLVLEYVDGETLADRIARGPLKAAEAVAVARQIADALEAAHERGIIHRDLKPANVKITSDEKVKVLDFGLAKALDPVGSSGPGGSGVPGGLTFSPTLSIMATQAGMILGTAAYMSPEQAKGLPVDQRSDVFSFGVVLFEMLTGRQPFHGETAPEILASVMIRDADLATLPASLHPRLRELLHRCLQKNPKQRWQHIGDVRAELDGIAADPTGVTSSIAAVAAPPAPLWRRALPAVVASVIVGAITATATWMLKPQPKPIVTRFSIVLPEGQQFTNTGRQVVAVSPNGTAIVYVANSRLMIRSNADPEPRLIPGSDRFGAVLSPVFSPDGQSLAFYAENAIRRIGVTGGAAVTLCQATPPFGMSWVGDSILFGQARSGIVRVVATGGKPETIVRVDDAELAHGPVMLPDGDAVMFTVARASATGNDRWDHAQIVAESLKTGRRQTLIEAGSDARYVRTGHLVYAVGGVLFAVRFDVKHLAVIGAATPIIEGVRRPNGQTGTAQFDVSPEGMAAYLPGPVSLDSGDFTIVIADRKGSVQPLRLAPGTYETPRLSPDAKRIALSTSNEREGVVWIYELSGASALRRLTTTGRNRFPVWSPDGQRVAFQSVTDNDAGIFVQRADGAGTPERLTKTNNGETHIPESWSPDGKFLLYANTKQTAATVWLLSLADRKSAPLGDVRTTRSYLPTASFSPDGRWVVYMSDDNAAAAARLYVQPFPGTGAKYELGPGIHPAWTRDGKEILHNPSAGRYGSYAITTQPTFSFASLETIPRPFADTGPSVEREFDPLPDGNVIAIAGATPFGTGSTVAPEIHVVLNWFEDLKQRVPVK